jgi:hypothetical protein
MEDENAITNISAARIVASISRVLAGPGTITHGFAETLRGNVALGGTAIDSWTARPIAPIVGGEPARIIVPDFPVGGMLTVLVSLVVLVWAVVFARNLVLLLTHWAKN